MTTPFVPPLPPGPPPASALQKRKHASVDSAASGEIMAAQQPSDGSPSKAAVLSDPAKDDCSSPTRAHPSIASSGCRKADGSGPARNAMSTPTKASHQHSAAADLSPSSVISVDSSPSPSKQDQNADSIHVTLRIPRQPLRHGQPDKDPKGNQAPNSALLNFFKPLSEKRKERQLQREREQQAKLERQHQREAPAIEPCTDADTVSDGQNDGNKPNKVPLLFLKPSERKQVIAREKEEQIKRAFAAKREESKQWDQTVRREMGYQPSQSWQISYSAEQVASDLQTWPEVDLNKHGRYAPWPSSFCAPGHFPAFARLTDLHVSHDGRIAELKDRALPQPPSASAKDRLFRLASLGSDRIAGSPSTATLQQPPKRLKPEQLPTPLQTQYWLDIYKEHYCMVSQGGTEQYVDKFTPRRSSVCIGNMVQVNRFRRWLETWKERLREVSASERTPAARPRAQGSLKGHTTKRRKGSRGPVMALLGQEDSDDDFQMPGSGEFSDGSDLDMDDGLSNTCFLSGPVGCGKTASMMACAAELGFSILELNASSCRSGKEITRILQEATLSHHVAAPGGDGDKTASSAPIVVADDEDAVEEKSPPQKAKGRNGGKQRPKKASLKRKGSASKKDAKKSKMQESGQPGIQAAVAATAVPGLANGVALNQLSLILVEDVDVVFEADKGFWPALAAIAKNAKRPIVFTSNDPNVAFECFARRPMQLCMALPTPHELAPHLQMLSALHGICLDLEEAVQVCLQCGCDIRRAFHACQVALAGNPSPLLSSRVAGLASRFAHPFETIGTSDDVSMEDATCAIERAYQVFPSPDLELVPALLHNTLESCSADTSDDVHLMLEAALFAEAASFHDTLASWKPSRRTHRFALADIDDVHRHTWIDVASGHAAFLLRHRSRLSKKERHSILFGSGHSARLAAAPGREQPSSQTIMEVDSKESSAVRASSVDPGDLAGSQPTSESCLSTATKSEACDLLTATPPGSGGRSPGFHTTPQPPTPPVRPGKSSAHVTSSPDLQHLSGRIVDGRPHSKECHSVVQHDRDCSRAHTLASDRFSTIGLSLCPRCKPTRTDLALDIVPTARFICTVQEHIRRAKLTRRFQHHLFALDQEETMFLAHDDFASTEYDRTKRGFVRSVGPTDHTEAAV